MRRRPSPRFSLWLFAVLVVVPSCSSLAVAAATVNGDKITETEVEAELDVLREDPIFGEALSQDPDARGQRRREILGELIYQKVAEQEAQRRRIRVTDRQVDRLIERSAGTRGLSVAAFLEQQNLSRTDAERLAVRGVRRFALMDEVVEEVEVDDDEVREVYEGQEERYVEVHLERITVPDQAAARDVLEQIDEGDGFAEVARDVSTDDAAEDGGDLGYLLLTSLEVEVQGAVSQAVEGGLTDPVRGSRGVEIYRLVDRRTKPFDDVASEIEQALRQDRRDELFTEWLVARVREAKVVVNPKYGSFDAQAQRPAVVPSTAEIRP